MYGAAFRAATRHNTSCSDIIYNIKMDSFKSSENIQKKTCGPDRSVSDNQSSSVTLNELAMKASKSYCKFKVQQRSRTMADKSPNDVYLS